MFKTKLWHGAVAFLFVASTIALIPGAFAYPIPEEVRAAASPASGSEVKAGLGIENLDLTGAAESFNIAPDTRIYAWARIAGNADVGNVAIVFSKGGKEVYSKQISVPSVPYRIFAYRTFRAGDAGEWKVSLAGADGKELAATAFKVEITK
jgi:hypothetical protein